MQPPPPPPPPAYQQQVYQQPQQQQQQQHQQQPGIVNGITAAVKGPTAGMGGVGPITVPGYAYAITPTVPLGITGYPRARPYFASTRRQNAENSIRYRQPLCGWCLYDYPPGPNIPEHWYDGGMGWVTKYFTDIQPFDYEAKTNGSHVCIVPVMGPDGITRPCNYPVEGAGCCDGTSCWCPRSRAPRLMAEHLFTHGIMPPPKRRWASDLTDCTGCLDGVICTPCVGSRQIMALQGYANTMSWLWCCLLCLYGIETEKSNDGSTQVYYNPPWTLVACLTRYRMITLNNIDEGCCASCLKALCCPCCSIGQTYRELTASGVWPGGSCNTSPPLQYMLQPAGMLS